MKEKLTDLLPYYRDVNFFKGTIENARFMMNKFLQANPPNSFYFPVNFEAILSNFNYAKNRNGNKQGKTNSKIRITSMKLHINELD